MLDYQLIIKVSDSDSFTLDKQIFKDPMEDKNSREFKLCPKVSEIHINVRGHERQRVKYATQLLSKSVSDALVYINKEKYENQASAIRVFDEFFDVTNSRTMFDKKSGRCGLGEYNYIFELIRPEVPRNLGPIKSHFIVWYGLFRFYQQCPLPY